MNSVKDKLEVADPRESKRYLSTYIIEGLSNQITHEAHDSPITRYSRRKENSYFLHVHVLFLCY